MFVKDMKCNKIKTEYQFSQEFLRFELFLAIFQFNCNLFFGVISESNIITMIYIQLDSSFQI